MPEYSNQEWLEALRSADHNEALAELREYLKRSLRYALSSRVDPNRLDALIEDSAQDALLRILDKMDTFRGESRFTTWASKVAIRLALTELRRKRWENVALEDLVPEDTGIDYTPAVLTDTETSPEQQTYQREVMSLVERLIMTELTPRQRQVMIAILKGGMPIGEAAERLGTNPNALYKMLHDARQRMKNSLEEEGYSADEILEAFSKG
ncbi:MAG: sigma-70 family RNA polymerase sigma factor [Anaerolineaceae bacterium]|jgi:RNA polymerase sigma-70 factor (ECF subfamily)|nr:sigma-70 family RNA polymerase sigma factor [Anaerolineaceae bacterium]